MVKHISFLAIVLLIGVAFASVSLPFQGLGASMDGNLSVWISNLSNCSNPFYNETFINSISNGHWYVIMGNDTDPLEMQLNEFYYLNYSINGNATNDSLCRRFQATVGNVTGTGSNTTINGGGNITGYGDSGAVCIYRNESDITYNLYLTYDNITGTLVSQYFAGMLDWSYLQNVPLILNGTNGIDGINGTNGINGMNGTDGINGSNANVSCGNDYLICDYSTPLIANISLNETTLNNTLIPYAKYEFGSNNFNGSGAITTSSSINATQYNVTNGGQINGNSTCPITLWLNSTVGFSFCKLA